MNAAQIIEEIALARRTRYVAAVVMSTRQMEAFKHEMANRLARYVEFAPTASYIMGVPVQIDDEDTRLRLVLYSNREERTLEL